MLQIHVEGEAEPLEPTPPHRFKSLDRGDWIPAAELRVGETLESKTGQTRVDGTAEQPGLHQVYNVEVEGEHHFFVGETGVLVHNGYAKSDSLRQRLEELPEEPGVYHIETEDGMYTGSATDLRARLSDTGHSAGKLLEDPNVQISYKQVDVGTANPGSQQNHVLRFFEQAFMDLNENVPMNVAETEGISTNSLNDIRPWR